MPHVRGDRGGVDDGFAQHALGESARQLSCDSAMTYAVAKPAS
jgi:hypothetical protein